MTEHELQQHLLLAFGTRRELRLFRQNSGLVKVRDRAIQVGPAPGCADLTGITSDGRRVEVEVKSAAGRQTKQQQSWERFIRGFGGVYVLVKVNPRLSDDENVNAAVTEILAQVGAAHG